MKNLIRVLVVGTSAKMSEMTDFLESIPFIDVVGRVASGTQAINHHGKLYPDIIFSEAALYGMSGFETARFIKEQNPHVKVVICSQTFNREFLLAVLSLKLDGYLPGYGNRKVLEETVNAVTTNASYMHYGVGSPEMMQLLIYQYQTLLFPERMA